MFKSFSDAVASGDLSAIVTSTVGQIIIWAIALVLTGLVFFVASKKKNNGTVALAYSGLAIALGTVLSVFTVFKLGQGGSATLFSMLAIVSIGYFYGLGQGLLCGFAFGLIQLAIGPYVVHPVQLLLDYPVAFAMLGLSGLFANKKFGLPIGYAVGVFGRYLMHTISGVVFFAEYAGDSNVLWYSASYNFTYIGFEGIITLVLLFIPQVAMLFTYIKKNALKSTTA